MPGIDTSALATALKAYAKKDRKLIRADFARAISVEIDNYCRKITKVNGSYQIYTSVMSHVVQGFEPVWKALGEWHARDKEAKSYRQKVNFPFVPAEVLGTALADMYDEDKELSVKDISKTIVDNLLKQVTDDVDLLSMIGVYDATLAHGNFGYSLVGWNKIIKDLLANTVHPCYKIPLSALTTTNILDQILKFEQAIPKKFRNKITEIHMSTNNSDIYSIEYEREKGKIVTYKDTDKTKSPLGKRAIVGHDDMADDIIFATFKDNMLNLLDVIENPATITDVQYADYEIKIFAEFEKGWDVIINEAVMVANFTDQTLGLGNADLMKLYYPHEAA